MWLIKKFQADQQYCGVSIGNNNLNISSSPRAKEIHARNRAAGKQRLNARLKVDCQRWPAKARLAVTCLTWINNDADDVNQLSTRMTERPPYVSTRWPELPVNDSDSCSLRSHCRRLPFYAFAIYYSFSLYSDIQATLGTDVVWST